MARPTRWSQLTIGAVSGVVIAALVGGVLMFARIGALHGATTRIYTVTDAAAGVIKGTEVWLGGKKVGLVDAVTFQSPATDTTERLAIAMDILSDYMPYIRRDSDIEIGTSGTLVGAPVMSITIGTRKAAPLHNGDTLRAKPQTERASPMSTIGSIGDTVVALESAAVAIRGQLVERRDALMPIKDRALAQLGATRAAFSSLSARVHGQNGTVGRFMNGGELSQSIDAVRAETNALRTRVDARRAAITGGSDTTRASLLAHLHRLLARTDSLRASLDRYRGGDSASAMRSALAATHASLDSLIADVKSHPLHYLPF